jgi:hypothetical protein
LDRLLGKPEPGSDIFLGDPTKFTENKNFTTASRQRIDRGHQQGNFLLTSSGRSGIRSIIYDEQVG